jgi:hypothetical protein
MRFFDEDKYFFLDFIVVYALGLISFLALMGIISSCAYCSKIDIHEESKSPTSGSETLFGATSTTGQ